MTSIVVLKDGQGHIFDARGIKASTLVTNTPNIRIKTDANNNILNVNSHITLTTDTELNVTESNDIDGGTF